MTDHHVAYIDIAHGRITRAAVDTAMRATDFASDVIDDYSKAAPVTWAKWWEDELDRFMLALFEAARKTPLDTLTDTRENSGIGSGIDPASE